VSTSDGRTELLRACLDMSDREVAVALAWIESNGPKRIDALLNSCLGRLAGEPATLAEGRKMNRDDAITAIAAAVDLLVGTQ
jgi:hypothetical protein